MITIADAVAEFLLSKKAGRRSPATLKWYKAMLKPFVESFSTYQIGHATMSNIAMWLINQRGSPMTLYDRDKALRGFWSWSVVAYEIKNPMISIPTPVLPEAEPKAIDPDDLNRLIEACYGERDRAIVVMLADCGLRASGLCGLLITDVDFANHMLRVIEKRQRVRSVPFSSETERCLLAWCKRRPLPADALFCTVSGRPLTYWGLREIVRRAALRAGFTDERCNLHSLRHFAAREYLRQGGSLPALTRILGHKSIDVTNRYYAVYAASELSEVHESHSPLKSLKRKGKQI